MLSQILITCQNIITTYPQFRNDLAQKFIDFTTLNNEKSKRTMDIIKGINVFAAQFYTLLSINNFADLFDQEKMKEIFSDADKLTEIK